MSTLFGVITWPFRAMLSLFLIVTMPMWRSIVPFIVADESIGDWLWKYLGPLGALISLATPFVWVPLFLIFWTWVYGLLFYWPAELMLYVLPEDLMHERFMAYQEMGVNVLSLLYIEPYHWIRRIPLEITFLMLDVIELAKMKVEDLYVLCVKLVGFLTFLRFLFYFAAHQIGYYR